METIWSAKRQGLRLGLVLAGSLTLIGIVLKLLGHESGGITILYYLIYPVVLPTWAVIAAKRHPTPLRFLSLLWTGLIAVVSGSALYSLWVIFNTRVLIGGPIPTLVEAMADVERRRAAGEIVTRTRTLELSMESPELFALMVTIQLSVWGLLFMLVAATLGHMIGKRKAD